ncbi:MAG: glutaredoxin 3 [Proteobacteria bacterium]|nr:glutaredoxin 3 [Pseudomonadota bacterium]MBW3616827.1 glutaredoxin 3 [Pseudomonadota bacterium]
MAADVTLYTKPGCPYCARALGLLRDKGVEFEEIVASNDPEKKAEMVARAGGKATFPQVFIGGRHIGGSDDLLALESRGELDGLLSA